MRRGWLEGELTLTMGGAPADTQFESRLVDAFEREACTVPESPGAELLKKCARIAYKAHVIPSIENEVHKVLKEAADAVAISVFSENVRKLLLSSPFGSKAVLGVDPGVRTGCKVALVDDSGKFLNHGVLKLQNDEGKQAAKAWLTEVLNQSTIQAIAVGNGTAGRETELFLRAFLKELGKEVPIVLVNEAGASVYSASEVAREEFPDLDVTIRGAISIARRLQDPLAELVKIDPKSIGVGQYQHDIAPHALKKSLAQVVDSCVHSVGINLNTASYHLLSHVSGIGEALAKAIVTRRGEKGLFRARTDLMEIPHFSAKTFELAAGFLRIPGAENILDNTGVHPEKYPILEAWASKKAKQIAEWVGSGVQELKNDKEFAAEIGEFTFQDILEELAKPGRDPRETFVPFQFREDIHELKDLQVGMECPGIVTNVTNFGAFVDIGVHQDGLVHLSQLADRFVKDPKEVVSPGDRVKVRVIEVNLEKKQIALSMKRERAERVERKPAGDRRPRPDFKRPERPQGGPQSQVAREARRPMPMKPKGPPKPKFTHNPFADLMSLKFEKDKK
jgi:uncharacterized protein